MRNGICASASSRLRFSSTMTSTFSTPVAGEYECEAICDEPEVRVGAGYALACVHAVIPREIASTRTAAPGRRAQCTRRSHNWALVKHMISSEIFTLHARRRRLHRQCLGQLGTRANGAGQPRWTEEIQQAS